MNYYKEQINKLEELSTIKLTSDTQSTKFLTLNEESLPIIIEALQRRLKEIETLTDIFESDTEGILS